MSFISFLLGAVVGGFAMKFYIDNQNEKDNDHSPENTTKTVNEDKPEVPDAVEITSDGAIIIEPTDKEVITTAIKALQKSRSRISIASVVRESRLSNYKVSKHKELIEKHKQTAKSK